MFLLFIYLFFFGYFFRDIFFLKMLSGFANMVDPNQIAPEGVYTDCIHIFVNFGNLNTKLCIYCGLHQNS